MNLFKRKKKKKEFKQCVYAERCPFCRGPAMYQITDDAPANCYHALSCGECGAVGPMGYGRQPIGLWNERADCTVTPREIKSLGEFQEAIALTNIAK